MGRRFTNDAQKAFLESRVPKFRDARQAGTSAGFFTETWLAWAKEWPESLTLFPELSDTTPQALTTLQQKNLADAELKRKKAIEQWFYRTMPTDAKQRTSHRAAMKWVEEMIATHLGRAPQALEVYQREYRAKIQSAIDDRVAVTNSKHTRQELMKIRREVVAELWKKEAPEVRQEVEKQTSRYAADLKKKKKKKGPKSNPEGPRTPEEYDDAIQALPTIIRAVFDAISEATGWVFHLSGGGPHPSDDGHIYVEHYYFGPSTVPKDGQAGTDFAQGYDNFKTGYEQPFAAHVKDCFTLQERHARTIQTGSRIVDISSGDTVVINGLQAAEEPISSGSQASSGTTVSTRGDSPIEGLGDVLDGAHNMGEDNFDVLFEPGEERFQEHILRQEEGTLVTSSTTAIAPTPFDAVMAISTLPNASQGSSTSKVTDELTRTNPTPPSPLPSAHTDAQLAMPRGRENDTQATATATTIDTVIPSASISSDYIVPGAVVSEGLASSPPPVIVSGAGTKKKKQKSTAPSVAPSKTQAKKRAREVDPTQSIAPTTSFPQRMTRSRATSGSTDTRKPKKAKTTPTINASGGRKAAAPGGTKRRSNKGTWYYEEVE